MQTRWAPPPTRVWPGVQSGGGQTDVEIAARRVRIWANDVRLGDQLFRRGGIEARQADRERNVQAEALPVIARPPVAVALATYSTFMSRSPHGLMVHN